MPSPKNESYFCRRVGRRSTRFSGRGSLRAWASLAKKCFQTCGLFAGGGSLSFVFDHRLSAVLGALFPFEISFCPLSGLI